MLPLAEFLVGFMKWHKIPQHKFKERGTLILM